MDWLFSLISPVANFVSSLFTNKANKEQTATTNATNQAITADTNATNKAIAENTNAANMTMNRENIAFQKQENEIARMREDNAVQRRASDLIASGLSKTLAAGSPASANAMNAPNNQFAMQTGNAMTPGHAMQAFRAEAPKFDFDYGQTRNNLANADAVIKNADTAKFDAQTKRMEVMYDMLKFAESHGLDLEKFGLDKSKFEFEKSMSEKKFDLDKYIAEESLSLEQKKYQLSIEQLDLKRDELNNVILDSVSERNYKSWRQIYESACLELDKNKDSREVAKLKYDIVEIKARVEEYLSKVGVNEAEARFIKQNTQKAVAEMVKVYAEAYNIDVQTRSVLEKTITEIYNRSVAEHEGTTTSGHVVSESEAAQNALDRANEQKLSGTASMRQFFSLVLMALFGIGGKGLTL